MRAYATGVLTVLYRYDIILRLGVRTILRDIVRQDPQNIAKYFAIFFPSEEAVSASVFAVVEWKMKVLKGPAKEEERDERPEKEAK